MKSKAYFFILSQLFVFELAYSQLKEINLGKMGRDVPSCQITGTCAYNATSDLLEMGLNRSSDSRVKVDFTEVMAASHIAETDSFMDAGGGGDGHNFQFRAEQFDSGVKKNYLDGAFSDEVAKAALQWGSYGKGESSFRASGQSKVDWLTDVANSSMRDFGTGLNGQKKFRNIIKEARSNGSPDGRVSVKQLRLDSASLSFEDTFGRSNREMDSMDRDLKNQLIEQTREMRQEKVMEYLTKKLMDEVPVLIGFDKSTAGMKAYNDDGSLRDLPGSGGHAVVASGLKEIDGEWFYILRDPNMESYMNLDSLDIVGLDSGPKIQEILLPVSNSHSIGSATAYLAPGDVGYQSGIQPLPYRSFSPDDLPGQMGSGGQAPEQRGPASETLPQSGSSHSAESAASGSGNMSIPKNYE
ncbi:hypothetical protein GW915_10625 [bacterium]|nr:hypothetical protein [bacterium]